MFMSVMIGKSPLPRNVGSFIFMLLFSGGLLSCAPSESEVDDLPSETGAPAHEPEATSLLGEALFSDPGSSDALANFAEAEATYNTDPDDPDAIIWLGRRAAYLGRYQDAIEVFSEGIAEHPGDARMYRHRGHRFVTTRQFDRAIDDFDRAAELIQGTEDEIEPDGLPNARNLPVSTLHTNIFYHLGLAHYLNGDFENALTAYQQGRDASTNPDMLVAHSHWLYMTLRRLGRDDEAAAAVDSIASELDLIESGDYHRLILMYKGEMDANELWNTESESVGNAATAYGVAAWHLYNGRQEQAEAAFRKIVESDGWGAFGYIAAEADLARLLEGA